MASYYFQFLPIDAIIEKAYGSAIRYVKSNVVFFLLLATISTVAFLFRYVLANLIPAIGVILFFLYQILLGNVLEYCACSAGIRLHNGKELDLSVLYLPFQEYGRITIGMLWYKIRRMLWLCVPVLGVIRAYSFMMTPYILQTEPELTPEEAIQRSVRMTAGHKMELFVQDMKLIGWRIINVASFKLVGIVYFYAYNAAIWAGFYQELRNSAAKKDTCDFGKTVDVPEKNIASTTARKYALSRPKKL